ncbi:TetR/AcrR family transcriptional regulator [Bradyrhizobium genosp. SA-3]|uniref:TetR/AcrR family transcriptional regulator n=1 Tax=Bradyrhizobium genosp. SA-3 TaxID=508868 RepID=UPI0010288F48|nr:TetR/AcrR family transcriptional regulator [Bradyrhizobium genosp. SA-3]RZN04504.1 TetR/AcrR family transcriptional regulator [Bradyrhizobium genosp. SA-3]
MAVSPNRKASKVGKAELPRDHILSAAAKLFRDQGFAATTLRQIAAAADMQAGSIYYHFASKDEILDEVLDVGLARIFDAVRQAVAECGSEAGAEDRILAAMSAHLRTLLSRSEFTSVNIRVYGQLPEPVRERHRSKRRRYGMFWDDLFRQAVQTGAFRSDIKVKPLRQFVLGALNWTVEWFDPERHSVNELVERCTQLILSGVRKQ